MTDIELLTAAAKAAGLNRGQWDYYYVRNLGHMVTPSMMWNPLDEDADALRLAVKLGIQLMFNQPCVYANDLWENMEAAPNAAARRAIVRAAAEIGKAMP